MTAVVLLILIVSLYFTIRKQYVLVFIFSFLGSISDSASPTIILDKVFPSFSYLMCALVFVAALLSFFQRSSENKRIVPKHYYSVAIAFIVAVFLIRFLQELSVGINIKVIARFVTFCVEDGIAPLLILLCWIGRFDIKKYLFILAFSHCILAFLTLYGELFGVPFFSLLNYVLYADADALIGGTGLNGEPLLYRGDFLSIFQNKYENFIFAYFGNPNVLGFYSGTLCLLAVMNILNKERLIISSVAIVLGVLLWLDAGTKAPLLAVVFIIMYHLWLKNKKLNLLPVLLILLVFLAPIAISLYNNQLSQGVTGSVHTREDLMREEWPFFMNHFLLGRSSLDHLEASPHQLWLLYGTELGIIGLLFALLYYYVFPFMDLKKKRSTYAVGVFALLFLVSNTNNFSAIVLFVTLFVSFVAEIYLDGHNPKFIIK